LNFVAEVVTIEIKVKLCDCEAKLKLLR